MHLFGLLFLYEQIKTKNPRFNETEPVRVTSRAIKIFQHKE